MSEKLLVTGATGKLGRSVIKLLLGEFGVAPSDIVAGSRDPSKLADFAAQGVAVAAVDFDKPETMAAAFKGIDRLLIISTDAIGHRLDGQKAAVAAAKAAGVKGIVYTSAPNPHGDNHPLIFAGDHAGTETAVVETGLPYRILRNHWYHENMFMSLPQVLKSGVWYTSETPETAVAYVAHEDCARAAAAALVRTWNDDKVIYDITGAETVSVADIAALATEATGKPIDVVWLTPEALADGLAKSGLPEGLITFLLSFDATNRAGLLSKTSNAVEELTGRKPRPFADFFKANGKALLA